MNQIMLNMFGFIRTVWSFLKSVRNSTYAIIIPTIVSIITFIYFIVPKGKVEIVECSVNNLPSGAYELDVTISNNSDKAIVISSSTFVVEKCFKFTSCASTVSDLIISKQYDMLLDTDTIKYTRDTKMSQLIKPKSADRFSIKIESKDIDALYLFSVNFMSGSKEMLSSEKIILYFDDLESVDIPDLSAGRLYDIECVMKNIQLIKPIESEVVLMNSRATELFKRYKLFFQSKGQTLNIQDEATPDFNYSDTTNTYAKYTETVLNLIPSDSLPEMHLNKNTKLVGLLVRKGGDEIICNGGLVDNSMKYRTAAHCFFNRRTGKRIELENLEIAFYLHEGEKIKFSERIEIDSVFIPEEYSFGNFSGHDIAYAFLKSPPKEYLLHHYIKKANSDSFDIEAIINVATISFDLNDNNKALEYVNKITNRPLPEASFFDFKGIINSRLGNFDDAINDFSEAINIDSNKAVFYHNRGITYLMNLCKYEESILDFSIAIEIDSSFFESYLKRGLAYWNMKQFHLALKDYDYILDRMPNYLYARYQRAILYADLGVNDMAIVDWNYIVEATGAYSKNDIITKIDSLKNNISCVSKKGINPIIKLSEDRLTDIDIQTFANN